MLKRQLGFTLIELTSVISIIGILAAIAIPNYMGYIVRAKISEGFLLSGKLITNITDYYAYTGQLPKNQQALAISERISGRYVDDITVENGAIHIIFKETANLNDNAIQNVITLRPAILDVYPPNNLITWVCGNAPAVKGMILYGDNKTTIPNKYLPRNCL